MLKLESELLWALPIAYMPAQLSLNAVCLPGHCRCSNNMPHCVKGFIISQNSLALSPRYIQCPIHTMSVVSLEIICSERSRLILVRPVCFVSHLYIIVIDLITSIFLLHHNLYPTTNVIYLLNKLTTI